MRDGDFDTVNAMPKASYNMVMTTLGTKRQAMDLARTIVRERLAACVQCWPIQSIYRWKGAIESGSETLLLCKTRSARIPALQQYIRAHHPYEIPEIVVTPLTGGLPAYLSWIHRETACPSLTFDAPATRKRVSRNGRKS